MPDWRCAVSSNIFAVWYTYSHVSFSLSPGLWLTTILISLKRIVCESVHLISQAIKLCMWTDILCISADCVLLGKGCGFEKYGRMWMQGMNESRWCFYDKIFIPINDVSWQKREMSCVTFKSLYFIFETLGIQLPSVLISQIKSLTQYFLKVHMHLPCSLSLVVLAKYQNKTSMSQEMVWLKWLRQMLCKSSSLYWWCSLLFVF